MSKLGKVEAGYIPAQYNAAQGTSCSTCRDFIKLSSECMITTPTEVSGPAGTCTLYVKGRPHEYGHPLAIIPQEIVGYIQGAEVPTSCHRCIHYDHPGFNFSTCEAVGTPPSDDYVDAGGCCNLYTTDLNERKSKKEQPK